MKSGYCAFLIWALLLSHSITTAWADTLVDLISHSQAIAEGELSVVSPGNWTLRNVRKLKGDSPLVPDGFAAPAGIVLSSQVNSRDQSAQKAFWFVGDYASILPLTPAVGGLLHYDGRWFIADPKPPPLSWPLRAAGELNGLWNGSTLLLETGINYVLARPNVILPDALSAQWSEPEKLGSVTGRVTSVQGVDLHRNGSLSLFVGSEKGDHLFRRQPDRETLADTIPGSASQKIIWTDLNADGWLDFFSIRDRTLSAWWEEGRHLRFHRRQAISGCAHRFMPRTEREPARFDCRERIVFPAVDGGNQPREVPLLATTSNWSAQLGEARRLLANDFNGDAIPDLLQISQHGAAFYPGQADGRVGSPQIIHQLGIPNNKAETSAIADFDADGDSDLVLAGPGGCDFWLNLGHAQFSKITGGAGQLASCADRPCSGLAAGDINNDGWVDLVLFHPDAHPTVFLNRGFASLQRSEKLDAGRWIAEAEQGQQGGLLVDLDHDGGLDLVLALRNGDIWLLRRAVGPQPTLSVHVLLDREAGPGPVRVTVQDRTGPNQTASINGGEAGAFFGFQKPGELTMRWQFPGGKPREKRLVTEESELRVWLRPDSVRTR